MKEILDIINPCRILKVEDWLNIAEIVIDNKFSSGKMDRFKLYPNQALRLLQRFEQLTSQPLTKEMFVCEVEKPSIVNFVEFDGTKHTSIKGKEYEECQSKVWFAGFEEKPLSNNLKCYTSGIKQVTVYFGETKTSVWIGNIVEPFTNPTVFDLLIEISRYNRTAQEKIQVNFTQNFCSELLK